MANSRHDGPNSHLNAQDIMVYFPERLMDEWDAADAAQRLAELDEARAHMTPEEYSVSNVRFAAAWAQHEGRVLARYRALHNHIDPDVNEESTKMRTRPLDSHFGSDGNQYNPYAPHTSEEYMLQEIAAGRMNPEMVDIPGHPSNPAQSPLPGKPPGRPSAHVQAGDHASWIAPDNRLHLRQGLNDPAVPVRLSDPRVASWFPHPHDDNPAAENLGYEEYADVYSAMLPYLDVGGSLPGLRGPHGPVPEPLFENQESPFDGPGPPASSLDPPGLNEILALGVQRQPYPASTGRERKRLAKPSLVVKLKIDSAQKSSQTPLSLRRSISDASSSSEPSSAAQATPISRPFNMRSRGSMGMSPTSARSPRSRDVWEPQAVRRLTRRAEATQSSHRKRRRDAVSPQDLSTEVTTTPTTGLAEGK